MWSQDQYIRQKREASVGPSCWGAVCPCYAEKPPKRKRVDCRWTVLASALLVLVAGAAVLFSAQPTRESGTVAVSSDVRREATALQMNMKSLNAVYGYPSGFVASEMTFSREELLAGKLLIVDKEHPLPPDAPAPNTYCVSANGSGAVPVRSADVRSSREAIRAMFGLFYAARQAGMEGLMVWDGTRSAAEQRQRQLERLGAYAISLPLMEAARLAEAEVDNPEATEMLLNGSMLIRVYKAWNGALDTQPLRMSEAGRYLLENAWKYGIVQRYPSESTQGERQYQFRYVGQAHAAAMRELQLDLDNYLHLLHARRSITIKKNGKPQYYLACKPFLGETASFELPEQAVIEASLDNLGYAVVACTLFDDMDY